MLADPETGRQREVHASPLLRREFGAAAHAHRAAGGGRPAARGRGAPDAAHGLRLDRRHGAVRRRPQAPLVRGCARELDGFRRAVVVPAAARRGGASRSGTSWRSARGGSGPCGSPTWRCWRRSRRRARAGCGTCPAVLIVLSLLILTVALAGPTAEQKVPRNRATVMLVIDVSLSMEATDVAPTRLKAAQDAATQFARNMTPGHQPGPDLVRGHGDGAGQPDHRPQRRDQGDREPEAGPVDGHR